MSIELTPSGFVGGKLSIIAAVNTHSVDLSQFDLKDIMTFEYGDKTYKPIAAPLLMGHHSGGEYLFDVPEELDSFTVRIKGIPQVEERIFEW